MKTEIRQWYTVTQNVTGKLRNMQQNEVIIRDAKPSDFIVSYTNLRPILR